MGVNFALEIGLSCPDCREDDVCYGDCICASCRGKGDAIKHWVALAPVMHALNERDVSWGFSYGANWWDTSVEVSLPDAEISITQYGDRFLAGLFMEVRRATYEQPSEWDEVEAHDGSAESIAEWVIEKETQGCLARLNF